VGQAIVFCGLSSRRQPASDLIEPRA